MPDPWDPAVLRSLEELHQRQPAIDGKALLITLALGALRRSQGRSPAIAGETMPITTLTLAWLNHFTELLIAYVTVVSAEGALLGMDGVADAEWAVRQLGIEDTDVLIHGPGAKARVLDLADSVWLSVPGIAEFCKTA
jgi:hypothetical protein